jgi:hypothetical protein
MKPIKKSTPAGSIPELQVLVTVRAAAAHTGLTEKAIRRKMEDGVWLETLEYSRTPTGQIFIDLQAVARWQRGQRRL